MRYLTRIYYVHTCYVIDVSGNKKVLHLNNFFSDLSFMNSLDISLYSFSPKFEFLLI